MERTRNTIESRADIKLCCELTDKIAKFFNVTDENMIRLYIGKYYYRHQKPYDPEHVYIPVYADRYKIAEIQFNLYTGYVNRIQFHMVGLRESGIRRVSPDGTVEDLAKLTIELEDYEVPDAIFAVIRGICTGDPVRM